MGKYSIKELEQLSGIKAHTIRIWEKRHHLIDPQRTQTNIRFYSDEDLKKIINVSLLNSYGFKISKIADMTLDEMSQKVLEISEKRSEVSIHIDQLVIAMVDLEEDQFEKILSNLILRYGFEKTITEIIYPFLEKIGILWQTRNITPAHEHFISNLIRQKIIVAIDGLPIPPKSSKKVLLYLREQEMHELGLLFYHFLARKAGCRTYYLGQNVPHQDLKYVCAIHNPEILITSITTAESQQSVMAYLETLAEDFSETSIFISGYQMHQFPPVSKKNIKIFSSASELKNLL